MEVVVIDGQGGGIGRSVIEAIRQSLPDVFIIAVGTNAVATSNMLKAGAQVGATGENAVIYNAQNAEVVIGPIGIAFANSMYAEISPKMAQAISLSAAHKLLIPVSKCPVTIVGIENKNINEYIHQCVEQLIEWSK